MVPTSQLQLGGVYHVHSSGGIEGVRVEEEVGNRSCIYEWGKGEIWPTHKNTPRLDNCTFLILWIAQLSTNRHIHVQYCLRSSHGI